MSGILDFPTNPVAGDTYSAPNGARYRFDGEKWVIAIAPGTADSTYVLRTGDTMVGPLVLADTPALDDEAANKLYVDSILIAAADYAESVGADVLAGATDYADSLVAGLDTVYVSLTGDTMTGGLHLPAPTVDAEAANKGYVDAQVATKLGQAQADAIYVNADGDTMTGALHLPAAMPTASDEAVHKAYVDSQVATRLNQAQADTIYVNTNGDSMTGPLILSNDVISNPLQAVTKRYVDTIAGLDTVAGDARYVLKTGDTVSGTLTLRAANPAMILDNGAGANEALVRGARAGSPRWDLVLGDTVAEGVGTGGSNFVIRALNGGGASIFTPITIDRGTGEIRLGSPLILGRQPVQAFEAATKKYVDDLTAAGAPLQLRGVYRIWTNAPDLTDTTNHVAGYHWLVLTQDPNTPEMLTVPLPGISPTELFQNGDYLYWDGGQYVRVQSASGLTKPQADLDYINASGDTMAGALVLHAPTSFALNEAVPRSYVDDALAAMDTIYVNQAGDTMTGPLTVQSTVSGTALAATGAVSDARGNLRYTPGRTLAAPGSLVPEDSGAHIVITNNATVTLPAGLAVGWTVELFNNSITSTATVQGATGVSIRQGGTNISGNSIVLGAWSVGQLLHLGSDIFVATGVGFGARQTVLIAGDTMTGALRLPADPTDSLDAATKHYVDVRDTIYAAQADTLYVAVAGDTMTGDLTINKASPSAILRGASGALSLVGYRNANARWAIRLGDQVAEGGGNTGSNFCIDRFADNSVQLPRSMQIERATGNVLFNTNLLALRDANTVVGSTSDVVADFESNDGVSRTRFYAQAGGNFLLATVGTVRMTITSTTTFVQALSASGDVTVDKTQPNIQLIATNAAPQAVAIIGSRRLSTSDPITTRWALRLGDGSAESGADAGSNFDIRRYSDNGTALGAALTIRRSDGRLSDVLGPVRSRPRTIFAGIDYTLVPADAGRLIVLNNNAASSVTMTVRCPSPAAAGISVGGVFYIPNFSSAPMSLVPEGDAALLVNQALITAPVTIPPYQMIVLTYTGGAYYAVEGRHVSVAGDTMTGDLTIQKATTPAIVLDATVAGQTRRIDGRTNGVLRWRINLGNNVPESGGNTGSDFAINRADDAGVGTPAFTINRTNGDVAYYGDVLQSAADPAFVMAATAAGQARNIIGRTGGANRWAVVLGDNTAESGANAGADFVVASYDDAGNSNGYPLTINRATGVADFSQTPTVAGQPISGTRNTWVRFNGATGAIVSGNGVVSVTRNGTGDYTVNFATPQPDTDYDVQITPRDAVAYGFAVGMVHATEEPTVNGVRIVFINAAAAAVDVSQAYVTVSR